MDKKCNTCRWYAQDKDCNSYCAIYSGTCHDDTCPKWTRDYGVKFIGEAPEDTKAYLKAIYKLVEEVGDAVTERDEIEEAISNVQ